MKGLQTSEAQLTLPEDARLIESSRSESLLAAELTQRPTSLCLPLLQRAGRSKLASEILKPYVRSPLPERILCRLSEQPLSHPLSATPKLTSAHGFVRDTGEKL